MEILSRKVKFGVAHPYKQIWGKIFYFYTQQLNDA